MLTETFYHMAKSDYWETGKLYPKLDAYAFSEELESWGALIYIGSSNQFKTQKAYKNWLASHPRYKHLTFKIRRSESN